MCYYNILFISLFLFSNNPIETIKSEKSLSINDLQTGNCAILNYNLSSFNIYGTPTNPNAYISTLVYNIQIGLHSSDLISTSMIEVREYDIENGGGTGNGSDTAYCLGETNVMPEPIIVYEFDITDIFTQSNGSLQIEHPTDFKRKCFEWRIKIVGNHNGNSCQNVSSWQYHNILS